MAQNQRYTHHDHIALPVPEGVKSGEPVRVGAYAGVALIDRLPDGTATVWLDGSWEIPVTGTVNPGDLVYIKTDRTLTATAAGNHPWGTAVVAKGTGTAPVEVAPFGHAAYVATASA